MYITYIIIYDINIYPYILCVVFVIHIHVYVCCVCVCGGAGKNHSHVGNYFSTIFCYMILERISSVCFEYEGLTPSG